jgi:hypothetical protein
VTSYIDPSLWIVTKSLKVEPLLILYDGGHASFRKRKCHAAEALSHVVKKWRMVSEDAGGWRQWGWGCPPSAGGV